MLNIGDHAIIVGDCRFNIGDEVEILKYFQSTDEYKCKRIEGGFSEYDIKSNCLKAIIKEE